MAETPGEFKQRVGKINREFREAKERGYLADCDHKWVRQEILKPKYYFCDKCFIRKKEFLQIAKELSEKQGA